MSVVIPTLSVIHPLPPYGSFSPLSNMLSLLQCAVDLSVSGHPGSIPPSGQNFLCVSWWVVDIPRDVFLQGLLSPSKDREHEAVAQPDELPPPWDFGS